MEFSRRAGRAAAVLAAAVALLAMPGVGRADHTPNHGDPCREADRATFFADYNRARQVHRPGIDCAFYRGITSGAGTNADGRPVYRPLTDVTRAQMAQFIVNTLVAAGYDERLPRPGSQDRFDDIGSTFARVAINRLARAGIVSGTGERTYSPAAPVTRQQMATYIVQAVNFAQNPDVRPEGTDRFRDVPASNVHHDSIEGGADAGLFQGTSTTRFSPGRLVVRDQMATFLVNLLREIFDSANAPVPFTARPQVDDTNVTAGNPVTGQVTGSNMRGVEIRGCGINRQPLVDRDETTTGIQFSVRIPASQPAGTCTLTFVVTFTSGNERTGTIEMNIAAANDATVVVDQSVVDPGGEITGRVTGSNVAAARVSGCGLTDENTEDRDPGQSGIQFTEIIPASQPAGGCTLTFEVEFVDNNTESHTVGLTVRGSPSS